MNPFLAFMIRHRLVNPRVVMTQTGLLLGTYLVVLGIPFVVGWWGGAWLERIIGREWWLVPLGLCTVLAAAGPFAYASLKRKAEARLLSDQRRYQRTLQLAARGMTQVRNLTVLSNLITRLVSRTVLVTHASLFLWDETRQRYVLRASHGPKRLSLHSRYELEASYPLILELQAHGRIIVGYGSAGAIDPLIIQEMESIGAAVVIPGLIEHHLIGFLALGPKRSGAWYTTDDIQAFSTLAHEAAMAIENAISYEELLKVNEQLKAASERLLIQERMVAAGQFATGMAHEIKNPLSAIKTFAQYLPEKYMDKDFREKFFRIVQDEIDRINTIVQELSDFAKPAPLELQIVHLSELVKDTLSLLSNHCLKQGVEVHTSFQENGFPIHADPQQLKQVLLNLLLNSLEAMEKGGRLTVATTSSQDRVKLTITDTGAGIEPADQRYIWDPFFTTKERGTGLGLPIVKGVVERHGGHVNLSSMPGRGTTVDLFLPIHSPILSQPSSAPRTS